MEFKKRTLAQIGDMICGNFKDEESFFSYRSSSYLTQFFQDCDTDHEHDGSTRGAWVAETLRQILAEPQPDANTPPETFLRVILAVLEPWNSGCPRQCPYRTGATGSSTKKKWRRMMIEALP
jgi:hypothetical protein